MDTTKRDLFEDKGSPPTKVLVCVRVMPDAQLRTVSHEETDQQGEAGPLGYLVLARMMGNDSAYWLINSSEPVHGKSAADLAAKATFQSIGLALEQARFSLDSRWIRSSAALKHFAYWENLYFVDITVSEKNRTYSKSKEGVRLSFLSPQQMAGLMSLSDRGHFLRLRYASRFADKAKQREKHAA